MSLSLSTCVDKKPLTKPQDVATLDENGLQSPAELTHTILIMNPIDNPWIKVDRSTLVPLFMVPIYEYIIFFHMEASKQKAKGAVNHLATHPTLLSGFRLQAESDRIE